MATGDVGHLDEHGRLFVDGRDDEMIVSGGENVFPREVEELFERHPAVRGGRGRGCRRRGVRPAPAGLPRAGAGRLAHRGRRPRYVRENLARYKTPREVLFLDELPRNPTGKIVKKDLPRD